MNTCTDCGYNLPHHGPRCPQETPVVYFCADHAPARPSKTDDQTRLVPCSVCGVSTRKGF